jgi:Na+/melibiose symporter-like transporter
LVFFAVPVLFLAIGVAVAWRYPLTHGLHRRLTAVLEKQRAGQAVDENEKRELTRRLIGAPPA